MSRIEVLVRWCLTLGGNIVNTGEKSFLKLYMFIYIQNYVY